MKRWLLIIPILTLAGLAAACSAAGQGAAAPAEASQSAVVAPASLPADPAPPAEVESVPAPASAPAFATQSNSERAVAVDVTPLNLAGGDGMLEFEVVFNTHSVDLNFDPAAISVLRDGQGREYPAVAWEGSEAGGHHRSGVLRFNVPDPASDFVEVIMHDVAGVPERVFHWDLAQ